VALCCPPPQRDKKEEWRLGSTLVAEEYTVLYTAN
jgi:hypothetical protein